MTSEMHIDRSVVTGGLLFIVFAPVHLSLPEEKSIVLAAVTLSLVGGAYIGFGAQSISLKTMLTELFVAGLFGVAAFAGVFLHWSIIPLALALALALHAGWDMLHHNQQFGACVPNWYIPFCVVFDLAAALFLLVLYAA